MIDEEYGTCDACYSYTILFQEPSAQALTCSQCGNEMDNETMSGFYIWEIDTDIEDYYD